MRITLVLILASTSIVSAATDFGEVQTRQAAIVAQARPDGAEKQARERDLAQLEGEVAELEKVKAKLERTREALEKADIVLLGDSFTEGSRVGDDDVWASLVARESGRSVYNLANSGDDPQKYYAKYDNYGLGLGADTVVVMFYEGNDFRRIESLRHSVDDYSIGESVANYFKYAPIRVRYERLLRNILGPIRSTVPVVDGGALSWSMPLHSPVTVPHEK